MSNAFHQGIDLEIKSWQNSFLRVFISEVHKNEDKYTTANYNCGCNRNIK